jgi:hypothetical protein
LPKSATALLMLVRLTGVIQLVLGLLFWSGSATALIPLHMTIGIIFVLCLWGLALVALRLGAAMPVITILWGALIAIVGFAQTHLMPGAAHWVIQVLHLVLGLVGIGLGEMLGGRLRRA